MSISFNNIPTSIRTPGVYGEVDNSRALQGLAANPQKALIIGEKSSAGSAVNATLYAITKESVAEGYFGPGALLTRQCEVFKKNNPNTELWAIALSGGTAQASCRINFSQAISHANYSCSAGGQYMRLLVNGKQVYRLLTSGWSMVDIASDAATYMSEQGDFPCTVSVIAASGVLVMSALTSGAWGNGLDVRFNYYDGESDPTFFGDSALLSAFEGGAGNGSLDDAWAIIDNEQFHYIIQPYVDTTNLTSLETELTDRFKPLEDLQGHGFTGYRGTQAQCTTLGNARNNPHSIIMGMYDSPTDPAELGAALGAVAAFNLNNDPARPLHYLQLKGILAPPVSSRFTTAEREILLYDGIATWKCDSSGNIQIERCITTYQTNASGVKDASYLDIQTLATLMEIRYQFKTRMQTRFISPRFKLADDTFPVAAGSYVATPKTIKNEIISLFTLLRDRGLIENLDEFVENLIVERDLTDVNRVNVLLPPDLINQFRILAAKIEFIL